MNTQGKKDGIVGRLMVPKGFHNIIAGTANMMILNLQICYFTRKKNLQVELRLLISDFNIGRLSWIISVDSV